MWEDLVTRVACRSMKGGIKCLVTISVFSTLSFKNKMIRPMVPLLQVRPRGAVQKDGARLYQVSSQLPRVLTMSVNPQRATDQDDAISVSNAATVS